MLHELHHHLHEQGHDLHYVLVHMLQELHDLQPHLERYPKGDLMYHHRIVSKHHHQRFQQELACAIREYHQKLLALHLVKKPNLE
eukprot:scaffold41.g6030.t1